MPVFAVIALAVGLLCVGFWIGWDVSAWWHARELSRAFGSQKVGGTD